MKRTQLFVLSVLAVSLHGAAQANPFPADAEASYNLPAIESYAERHARTDATWGVSERQIGFPADAEASYNMPARDSYAERQARKPNSAELSTPRMQRESLHFAGLAVDD